MKQTLAIAVLLLAGPALAVDKPIEQSVFEDVTGQVVSVLNAIDFEAYQALLSDDYFAKLKEEEDITPEEYGEQWANGVRSALASMGEIESFHFEEADPPDGAFLMLQHERGGSGELFLVLNEDHKVTELSLRPTQQHSCAAGGGD